MTVRERQVRAALETRKRQVERAERIEALIDEDLLHTHHGHGVNVKAPKVRECVWKAIDAGADEDEAEAVVLNLQEAFWRDAGEIAVEHDFATVHSAGREAGYCLVHPQPSYDDMWENEVLDFKRERLGPWACDVLDLAYTLALEAERELKALSETSDRS